MRHNHSDIIRNFMHYTKTLRPEDFVKSMLLCFGAPTITGIKAATLLNFRRGRDENLRSLWLEHADEWLAPLGINWLLMNEHSDGMNALVLIYSKELLAHTLCCDEAYSILKEYGYPLHDVDACLECLREKFCSGFPHEIGLFLDYPPEDVRGFIENRPAKKISCPCYWKVYGSEKEAVRKFWKYKRAECEAARLILTGE